MIREATEEELPQVIALLKGFFEDSVYSELGWDEASIEAMFRELIRNEGACLLVTDDLSGAIGGYAVPYWMNRNKVFVQEMFWWVAKEKRGGLAGPRLLAAFEAWAKHIGAHYIAMSTTTNLDPEGVGKFLKRASYVPVDISYLKKVT